MKAFGGNVENADRATPSIAPRRLPQEHWENRPCKFRDCAMTPVGGTVQKGDDTISAMVYLSLSLSPDLLTGSRTLVSAFVALEQSTDQPMRLPTHMRRCCRANPGLLCLWPMATRTTVVAHEKSLGSGPDDNKYRSLSLSLSLSLDLTNEL